ncbi:MAG: 50S ribosomal protein L27 [bacterium]
MAHKKASAASANQGGNVSGKRLGVKKYGGEIVKAGMIIVRQTGTKIFAGKNTFLSRNFSIHAKTDGVVKFKQGAGNKRGSKVVVVEPVEVK